jgi:hypothetical protein
MSSGEWWRGEPPVSRLQLWKSAFIRCSHRLPLPPQPLCLSPRHEGQQNLFFAIPNSEIFNMQVMGTSTVVQWICPVLALTLT